MKTLHRNHLHPVNHLADREHTVNNVEEGEYSRYTKENLSSNGDVINDTDHEEIEYKC